MSISRCMDKEDVRYFKATTHAMEHHLARGVAVGSTGDVEMHPRDMSGSWRSGEELRQE